MVARFAVTWGNPPADSLHGDPKAWPEWGDASVRWQCAACGRRSPRWASRQCGECAHAWRWSWMLSLYDWVDNLRARIWVLPRIPSRVWVCPCCAHDL